MRASTRSPIDRGGPISRFGTVALILAVCATTAKAQCPRGGAGGPGAGGGAGAAAAFSPNGMASGLAQPAFGGKPALPFAMMSPAAEQQRAVQQLMFQQQAAARRYAIQRQQRLIRRQAAIAAAKQRKLVDFGESAPRSKRVEMTDSQREASLRFWTGLAQNSRQAPSTLN